MNDADQQDPDNERQPIWSVPVKKATLFFTMFTILNMVGMAYFAWYEIFENDQVSIHETIQNILVGCVGVFVFSAGVSVTATEVVVVIGTYLRDYVFKPRRERIEAEARAAGRAEERKVINARMQRWNRRRLDAEARGEPFDEPIPLDDDNALTDDTDSEDEAR